MKRFLKGCLITFAILFGLIVIGSIALYLYWQSPNKIEFSDSPIKKEKYLNSLSFENRKLPDFILKPNEKDILYQAFIKDDGLDMTVTYKVVIKFNKNIELENSLPLKSSEKEKINNEIAFNKIEDNGFNPQIKIPEDKETQSGRHLTIFSQHSQIFLTLKNGGYSYSHDELDKDGYVTDIIIYDKESKLLYFERQRYYAFQ
jgi:hypothetical protein